ncbi:MAG TPA: cytochrome c oxidase subunit II [Usitatibacter sp.]|jgi:cytochrome c oxidase subunit 2|nr:cytochrome c oxidase subunit II [Usitatibacter sp.]
MNALQDVLHPAGVQAGHIAHLWWFTVALCAVVFVAILAGLSYALWRAPRADARSAPDMASMDRPESGAKRAVVTAVALSILGLLALLGASVATDRALATLPLENAVHIEVVGHQWWWQFNYDDPIPARVFSTANEMHIPVGRPVVITLQAGDVIHSFWVPNLHGKKDLIPGRITTIQLRADQAGTYRGQCAEFCGLQHAFMAFTVVAEDDAAFQRWADAQRKPAPEPTDAKARRGHDLFMSGTCMMCHPISGTTANARKAPDLTHIASRPTLAAGTLPNDPQGLAAWIRDPQKLKPGAQMPAHHVPDDELDALVAYLETLR